MNDEELFSELEHTADLGIELAAPTRSELFRRAALALARLMVGADEVGAVERRELEVRADSDADLMHDLLSALLNLFVIDAFIWREAQIAAGRGRLGVILLGERLDRARHEFRGEIKAVTYHQLAVEQRDGQWRARVIFDV